MPRGNRNQPVVSCQECRRMKWKCDREFPCSNCRKRGLGFLCPNGSITPNGRNASSVTNEMLQQRILELEAALNHAVAGSAPLATSASTSAMIGGTAQASGGGSSGSSTRAADELNSEYGQLILGDQPGSSRFFAQITPTYLHAANQPTRIGFMPISPGLNGSTALPPRATAEELAKIYFTIGSPNNAIVSVQQYDRYLDEVYDMDRPDTLAIVLLVSAIGVQMDPSRALYDGYSEELFTAAKSALAHGKSSSTPAFPTPQNHKYRRTADIADPDCSIESIQSILLMSRFIGNCEHGASMCPGFWGLLGYATRSAQQLGLHRDGSRWGLPDEDVAMRQRLFWEVYTEDILQCVTQGRPRMINDWSIDTLYPTVGSDLESRFHDAKYRYVRVMARINDLQCRIKPLRYSEVLTVDRELREVHENLSPDLLYPEGSPSSGRALRHDMQRLVLRMLHAEALFFLHRTPFAHALRDSPHDPLQSPLQYSYIAELESSRMLIQLMKDALLLNADLSYRWWNFFFHCFNAMVTLAAAIAKSPGHLLAPTLMMHLEQGYEAFASVPEGHVGRKVLPLLVRLRSTAQQDIATRTSAGTEPMELLGVDSKLHRMPSIFTAKDLMASAPTTPPRESSAEIPMDNTFDALRGFFDVDAFMQEFGLLDDGLPMTPLPPFGETPGDSATL